MSFSILKYCELMLSDTEDLEEAKKKALRFVTPQQSDDIEIQDSSGETVTIGYFDGYRFHWAPDKLTTEAWKSCSWTTKPPVRRRKNFQEGN